MTKITKEHIKEAREKYSQHLYDLVYTGDDMIFLIDRVEELNNEVERLQGVLRDIRDSGTWATPGALQYMAECALEGEKI